MMNFLNLNNAWINRGTGSNGSCSCAYRILENFYQQQEIPFVERNEALRGCCFLGCCSQLPANYLPGIKSYNVPPFLKDSLSQDEWKALVVRFNQGMDDVR